MTTTGQASTVIPITEAKLSRIIRTDKEISKKDATEDRLTGGVVSPEEDVVLDVDMTTGEVIAERPIPDEISMPSREARPLDQCRDKQEVLEWSGEDARKNVEQSKSKRSAIRITLSMNICYGRSLVMG